MTVGELIKELEKFPENMDVIGPNGCSVTSVLNHNTYIWNKEHDLVPKRVVLIM